MRETMNLTRRNLLALGGASITMTLLPLNVALGGASETKLAIDALTGGAEIIDEGVSLTLPELVEDGNLTPLRVEAEGAVFITIFAQENPIPEVITFNFGELAGSSFVKTRIRLSGTQKVIAIAKMNDGSFRSAASEVKVTVGGCGS